METANSIPGTLLVINRHTFLASLPHRKANVYYKAATCSSWSHTSAQRHSNCPVQLLPLTSRFCGATLFYYVNETMYFHQRKFMLDLLCPANKTEALIWLHIRGEPQRQLHCATGKYSLLLNNRQPSL